MADLTNPELEILSLAVDGLTVHQIAERLGKSPNTIKSTKSRLFKKLGANNMTEATFKTIHEIADWRNSQRGDENEGVFFAR